MFLLPLRLMWWMTRFMLIQAGQTPGGVRAKAAITEARLTSLLNNGGSFGGNLYVVGDHHVTGAQHTDRQYISGTQLTINKGAPGYSLSGAPGSYSASWETNLMHFVADLYSGLQNANILQ